MVNKKFITVLTLLGNGDKAVVFKLPHLDRRLESSTITVAVQDFNKSIPVDVNSIENDKLADNLCHSFGKTWISQVLKVPNLLLFTKTWVTLW